VLLPEGDDGGAPVEDQRIAGGEIEIDLRVGGLLQRGGEARGGPGVEPHRLAPDAAGEVDRLGLFLGGGEIVGVHEQRHPADLGDEQQLQALGALMMDENRCTPVVLPPGLFRLDTRPWRTGIATDREAIGVVLVASCAARAEAMSPVAARTATFCATSSAASFGSWR